MVNHYSAEHGRIINGDSSHVISSEIQENSLDLIFTSPPFGLIREKAYGNVQADDYLDWFRSYAEDFFKILKNSGSLVIDIGGVWNKGKPTRHLYHFELLIMLCKEFKFHLAQDLYWWNPAKLPTPAEWVTIRRIRLKDAINQIWWLSKSPWPKASNTRVLQPYSDSMRGLFKNGYKPNMRPSGHDISDSFGTDNSAAIPPNLLAIANTESNSPYMRYCRDKSIKPHPARFPLELPEFFIRMLTDEGDSVLDPFAGSCTTGEICEKLKRKWICIELESSYIDGAKGRFDPEYTKNSISSKGTHSNSKLVKDKNYFKLPKVGVLWDSKTKGKLPKDGGKLNRKIKQEGK